MGLQESFFYAVSNGNIEAIARALVSETLNINAKNTLGQTAIFLAAYNRDKYICKILIAFGADPTIECLDGLTALSVSRCNLNIFKILNNRREHVEYKENRGNIQDMFLSAVLNGQIKETIKMLTRCATLNKNIQDRDGKTAIHLAVSNNDLCLLMILYVFGANLDVQDNQGYIPLSIAVLNDNLNMVQALLSLGAKQGISNIRGNFPIHIASEKHHNITKLLLKQPDIKDIINTVNYNGLTPLYLAVICNNTHAVMELLKCDDINVDIHNGTNEDTALIMAAKNDNLKIVRALLGHKANPDLKNNDGKTFFDFAVLPETKSIEISMNLYGPIICKPSLTKRKIFISDEPPLKRGRLMSKTNHPLESLEMLLQNIIFLFHSLTYKRKCITNMNSHKPYSTEFLVYTCAHPRITLSESSSHSSPISSNISSASPATTNLSMITNLSDSFVSSPETNKSTPPNLGRQERSLEFGHISPRSTLSEPSNQYMTFRTPPLNL